VVVIGLVTLLTSVGAQAQWSNWPHMEGATKTERLHKQQPATRSAAVTRMHLADLLVAKLGRHLKDAM
jgi:hypothetical protein